MDTARYAVFEAVNSELGEIFVAATSVSIFEAMSRLSRALPQAVSHWEFERHHIRFRSLMFGLAPEETANFVRDHMAKPLPDDWKYVGLEAPH